MVWVHLISALLAIVLGVVNLASVKGTTRHRTIGYCWLVIMVFVTVPSFWIRGLNHGEFSWIHGLSVWALFCMAAALVSIKRGNVKRHAAFMIGTMIGAIVAGAFALAPGRFISSLFGYS